MASSTEASIGSLVGTPDILSHSDVSDASNANQPVPVPSIYQDERGEIHNLKIGDERLNLLRTKAGVMRSGDLHADTQHDFVFSGKVRVWIMNENGITEKTVYGPYQYLEISPYVPHIFEFLEDTVIAEWWDRPFHAWFYQPYRRIVQLSFQTTTTTTTLGHFSHDIMVDREAIVDVSTSSLAAKWWCTGVVIGMTIGYLLGRRR
jgi:hypothetical protein